MRARIVFVWDTPITRTLQSRIQQVLSDVAVAFGHSFIMKDERCGQASIQAYASPMTEETIEECREADGVLALLTGTDGLLELAQGMGAVLSCHVYDPWPAGAVDGRLKSGHTPEGIICYPLYGDARLARAAELAYQLTGVNRTGVREIPFDGSLQAAWAEATGKLAQKYTTTLPVRTTLNEALTGLITRPEALGVVFSKPGAAETLCAAADALCGDPAPGYIRYVGGKTLHAYQSLAEAGSAPPSGALAAAADLLRTTLNLSHEADCLFAAMANVNAITIQTPGEEVDQGWERISQQIALVGELLHPTR